uniref:ATP synthase F0 subunit 8 n=1 Tax=Pielomastax zhengi TaxID=997267 RepID=G8DZ96_9ORTH|nr:ATP synthase F0 subunit 8 [Pielomastax zhengi]ADZ62105.1 ATP synthase F0 subunit 8 [Pielomastax zhengi]
MPQMSPLMWSTMMILFSTMFIVFNSMIYFSFKNKKTTVKINGSQSLTLNWKW